MKKIFTKTLKYTKRHQKLVKHFGLPLLIGVLLFSTGMLAQYIRQERAKHSNIVWAIDETVKIPSDLKKTLLKMNNCQNYRGGVSPRGVGLWGVVQVEQNNFAKIAHGCSWSVSNQVLAVKQDGKWQIVPPVEYFFDTTQGVPTCMAIVKYHVPAALEGFCLNDSGKLTKNPNPT